MGNFLRHSFAHFGSSQVEAIATILSFHLHSATKLNKIKEHIRFLCIFTLGPCAAHARYLWHRQAGESLFLSCRLRCHPGDHIHARSCEFTQIFLWHNLAPATLFSLNGLPPPQSSYISGSQQHPSRSNTNAFGRRDMVFRSSDSMKLHTWD